jgi:proteasome lid subunit RPN8/RPN11
MHNPLNNNILKKIKEYSLNNLKEEICGFIYINNLQQKFFLCSNISFDRKNNFLINPEDYEKCNFKGNILCCFHSHINNRGFSSEDIQESLKNNLPYLLYNIKQDKFYFFDAIKNKSYEQYINIPYKNGYNDCWSIIQKYYKNELNINISDPEPDRYLYDDEYEWARIKKQKYNYEPFSWEYDARKQFFNSNNLFKVEFSKFDNLNKGDILITKYTWQSFPSFGSIYLGENLILEHVNQEPSKIYSLRKGHEKVIQYILRYKYEQ